MAREKNLFHRDLGVNSDEGVSISPGSIARKTGSGDP